MLFQQFCDGSQSCYVYMYKYNFIYIFKKVFCVCFYCIYISIIVR